MAVTQSSIDSLQTAVETDGTLTNAQKARVGSLLYQAAVILFGSNSSTTISTSIAGNSGKVDGHLG